MNKRFRIYFLAVVCQMACLLLVCPVFGQQTLGGVTGVVTDAQGGILPGTVVTAVGDQTGLTRTQTSARLMAWAVRPVMARSSASRMRRSWRMPAVSMKRKGSPRQV